METKTILIHFTINGEKKNIEIPGGISALELIRDILGLKGPKEGCGIGECGACTIIVDGKTVNACLMFAAQMDGRDILTVEGLSRGEDLHPIQRALAEQHAVQCGFCTPGVLMSAYTLYTDNPHPTRGEIVRALAGNLCRCTGYQSIIAGIEDGLDSCRNEAKKKNEQSRSRPFK